MQALDLSLVEKRSDADKLLADHIPEAGVRAFLLQSLNVKEKSWLLNLDVLGAQMPKIVGWPELSTIPNIQENYTGPTFFLSGGNSTYVDREHRPAIKALFPKAKFAAIPNTGHWLHAEKPREFEAALRAFIGFVET
jgi:pimeloyl-ACP methyl ester carboxylesterase